MNDLNDEIQAYRYGICEVFLKTIAIIAIPALFASLYRINEIGWQPVMVMHIFIATILWGITLFRKSIPYKYQASFIVLMFITIGLGGIWQFGLIAGGVAFLVISSPIATLFFSGRTGILVLVLVFLTASIIGFLTVSGLVEYNFDITQYAVSDKSWANSVVGWALASVALTLTLNTFNAKLINSLKKSREQQEALNNRQLELEKTIKEKDKALDEIQILQGIIPICSYCHSIRNDEGAWNHLEAYISKHSDATFSHGICPDCLKSEMKKEEAERQKDRS